LKYKAKLRDFMNVVSLSNNQVKISLLID